MSPDLDPDEPYLRVGHVLTFEEHMKALRDLRAKLQPYSGWSGHEGDGEEDVLTVLERVDPASMAVGYVRGVGHWWRAPVDLAWGREILSQIEAGLWSPPQKRGD